MLRNGDLACRHMAAVPERAVKRELCEGRRFNAQGSVRDIATNVFYRQPFARTRRNRD